MNKDEFTNKIALIYDAIEGLNLIKEEEEEKFDNMSQTLRKGAAGDRSQDIVIELGEAIDDLTDITTTLETIRDS